MPHPEFSSDEPADSTRPTDPVSAHDVSTWPPPTDYESVHVAPERDNLPTFDSLDAAYDYLGS